ncbi:MAG: DUF3568 family protein [Phycisphaerales bacterium]
MNRISSALVLSAGLALTTLPLAGCLAVAAAAGAGVGVAYVNGAVETTLDANLERASKATERALDDLKITLISGQESGVDAHYKARTADDTSVTIKLQAETDKTSSISIRVGTFGDKNLSLQILDKIKSKL